MAAAAAAGGAAGGAAAAGDALQDLMPSGEDLLYEEELLRNPYSLRMWARYLDARKDAPPRKRYLLYERALRALPGSYKLWHAYLRERRADAAGAAPDSAAALSLAHAYGRALVPMHKMPRLWLEYLEHLVSLRFVTRTRRAFDAALRALPVGQHDRVWPLFLKFVHLPGVPEETAVRVYRRYLRLEPHHAEEYVAYLKARGRWGEAAARLAALVDDASFRSLEGRPRHALWLELCNVVTRHPAECGGMPVEAILRAGIRRHAGEAGRLWASLADWHIRRGAFERARDVYEEAITSVATVRDFSLVFDAACQFEESLIAAKMEQQAEEEKGGGGAAAAAGDDQGGDDFVLVDDGDDLDLRLARLEALVERRPELLSAVVLRQNPHSVAEWHRRAALYAKAGDAAGQIRALTEAVRTVDAEKAAGGKPHSLWLALAAVYEAHGDLANARVVFDRAAAAPLKYADDLAALVCARAEMELRHKNYGAALAALRGATAAPPRRRPRADEAGLPPAARLYRSPRLWAMRVDLEESLADVDAAAAAYEAALDLRVASPQMVLNYAEMLWEARRFEAAFAAYERGVAAFKFPHARDLWTAYLQRFTARYGGAKLERARDLFRQACAAAPPADAAPFFLARAAHEEAHGLARAAMAVYDEALAAVPADKKLAVLDVYLARAAELFGVAKVREVYEAALSADGAAALADADALAVARRYAALEARLGEAERARAVLAHAAPLAEPRAEPGFWAQWHELEVSAGSEETFREMLRVKRAVAASSSAAAHFGGPAAAAAAADAAAAGGAGKRKRDEMAELEAAAAAAGGAGGAPPGGGLALGTRVAGFVSAGVIQQGDAAQQAAAAAQAAAANPEEVDLGDDDGDGGGGDAAEIELEPVAVPDAVFGSVKRPRTDGGGGGE